VITETRVLPNPQCLLTELADGTGVLLHLDTKFYYSLNATGVVLWKAMHAGLDTLPKLRDRICEVYEIDPTTAENDVAEVVQFLADEGMLCLQES